RIAVDTGTGAGHHYVTRRFGPHQVRIDRQRQRRIEQAGVLAELLRSVAARSKEVAEARRRRAVVLLDRVRPDRRRRPLTIEAHRDRLLAGLRRAVITEEDDVAEAVDPRAAGRRLQ